MTVRQTPHASMTEMRVSMVGKANPALHAARKPGKIHPLLGALDCNIMTFVLPCKGNGTESISSDAYLAAGHTALGGEGLQVYEGVAGAAGGSEAVEGALAIVKRLLKRAAGNRRCGQIGQGAQLVAGCCECASGCP